MPNIETSSRKTEKDASGGESSENHKWVCLWWDDYSGVFILFIYNNDLMCYILNISICKVYN